MVRAQGCFLLDIEFFHIAPLFIYSRIVRRPMVFRLRLDRSCCFRLAITSRNSRQEAFRDRRILPESFLSGWSRIENSKTTGAKAAATKRKIVRNGATQSKNRAESVKTSFLFSTAGTATNKKQSYQPSPENVIELDRCTQIISLVKFYLVIR